MHLSRINLSWDQKKRPGEYRMGPERQLLPCVLNYSLYELRGTTKAVISNKQI